MPKTATKIDGLPGFMLGYEISDDGTHAIVFTDKMQGADSTLDTPNVQFTNKVVSNFSRVIADPAADGRRQHRSSMVHRYDTLNDISVV